MTEQNPNMFGSELPPGARLRAAADGELGPEGKPSVDGIERLEARMAFERDLREAVGRAMSGPEMAAPAALHARLEAMLAGVGPEGGDMEADVVRSPLGDTRDRSFWSGVGRFAAVAAVLALCATVAVVATRHFSSVTSTPSQGLRAGLLASFVSEQHDKCTLDGEYSARKFTARDHMSSVELARQHLGGVPRLVEAGFKNVELAGFTFWGMGRCAVPGEGPSVHLVFREDRSPSHLVSLFIQADRDEWALERSRCALLHEGLEEEETVAVWRDGGYMHFLFAERPEDLEVFRRVLDVPERECRLGVRGR